MWRPASEIPTAHDLAVDAHLDWVAARREAGEPVVKCGNCGYHHESARAVEHCHFWEE